MFQIEILRDFAKCRLIYTQVPVESQGKSCACMPAGVQVGTSGTVEGYETLRSIESFFSCVFKLVLYIQDREVFLGTECNEPLDSVLENQAPNYVQETTSKPSFQDHSSPPFL